MMTVKSVLREHGYQLNDDKYLNVVAGIMEKIGKGQFAMIADLDRQGYRSDVPDRRLTRQGPVVAAAFGYFRSRERWYRYSAHNELYARLDPNVPFVMHPSDPQIDAAHDWCFMRRGEPLIIERIKRN